MSDDSEWRARHASMTWHAAYGAAFAQWIERAADHRRLSYVEACADDEVRARAHEEATAVASWAALTAWDQKAP